MQKRKRQNKSKKIDSELKSAKAEILRKGSYGVYELLNKNQTPKTKTRAEQLDAAVLYDGFEEDGAKASFAFNC